MSDRVPVRPDLADLEPYGAPQLDVPIRLNTNETAEPPPADYLAAVADRIAGIPLNRYPDRRHTRLRELLGQRVGLPPARVWAANGSNEVLSQLLQAYGGPGRRLATVRPGYSMYPVLARVTMTDFLEVDLEDDFTWSTDTVRQLAEARPDVVIVSNPNNPTGVPVDARHVVALHDAVPDALLVMDEAYVEFSADGSGAAVSAVDLLDELPRLVVSRTFSKAFRLAGLRVGYLYGQDWVIDDVRRVRLPYHLDALKQAAAEVALEQEAAFLEHRGRVAEERERVRARLAELDEVEAWPSAANFLLFRVPDARAVFDGLLAEGVLVRDFSAKPRLGGCLRVTIGTRAENDAFLQALATVVGA